MSVRVAMRRVRTESHHTVCQYGSLCQYRSPYATPRTQIQENAFPGQIVLSLCFLVLAFAVYASTGKRGTCYHFGCDW
eukprot:302095-Rhodomonas_salina.1